MTSYEAEFSPFITHAIFPCWSSLQVPKETQKSGSPFLQRSWLRCSLAKTS